MYAISKSIEWQFRATNNIVIKQGIEISRYSLQPVQENYKRKEH